MELADLTKSIGSGSESARVFDTTSCSGGSLLGLLLSDLLSGGLATSVLASSLSDSCHLMLEVFFYFFNYRM